METKLTIVIGAGKYPPGAKEIGIRGGDEDSLVPSLVMEASVKRYWPEARVINTYGMDKPRMNRKNPTPFSLVRFMVPKLCDFSGWGVYCDADQIVFDDIRKIMDPVRKDLGKVVYIAKQVRCTGVVLMDASKLKHWDAWDICDRIDGGYPYGEMMCGLNGIGLPGMGDFGQQWNSHDVYKEGVTKLLHYTNLAIQPWKFPGVHAFEHVWAKSLSLAIEEGFVNDHQHLNDNCRKILDKFHAKV